MAGWQAVGIKYHDTFLITHKPTPPPTNNDTIAQIMPKFFIVFEFKLRCIHVSRRKEPDDATSAEVIEVVLSKDDDDDDDNAICFLDEFTIMRSTCNSIS